MNRLQEALACTSHLVTRLVVVGGHSKPGMVECGINLRRTPVTLSNVWWGLDCCSKSGMVEHGIRYVVTIPAAAIYRGYVLELPLFRYSYCYILSLPQ